MILRMNVLAITTPRQDLQVLHSQELLLIVPTIDLCPITLKLETKFKSSNHNCIKVKPRGKVGLPSG